MYLKEISNEIGKLASGSTASVAELSVGAQEKWDAIHDPAMPVKEMLDLLEETKAAASYRIDSVQRQMSKTRERMRTRDYSTFEGEGETKPSHKPAVEQTATPVEDIKAMKSGETFWATDPATGELKQYRKR